MIFSDISDEASALESLNIEIALSNRRKPEMKFTGKCYWCDESIDKGHYCNSECREDHQKYMWANNQRSVA